LTYSAEKLISPVPRISQVNPIMAENWAYTSTLAHYDRLRPDIVGNRGPFRSFKIQAFKGLKFSNKILPRSFSTE
jgi:hypothetical protein